MADMPPLVLSVAPAPHSSSSSCTIFHHLAPSCNIFHRLDLDFPNWRVAENHSKTHLKTIQISSPRVKFMDMCAILLNAAFFSSKNVNSKAEQTAEIYLENLQKYFGRYPNSGPAFLTIMLSMFAATFARNCLFSNPVSQARTFPTQLQTFNFPRERYRESWKA